MKIYYIDTQCVFKFRLLPVLTYLFTSPVLRLFVYACCAVSYIHRAHQSHRPLQCLSFIRTLIGTKYHEVSSPSAQTPPSVGLLSTHTPSILGEYV